MKGIENEQFDILAYARQKYQKGVWEAVEHILRNHIDNPIDGELTREKIKAAGIRSVFFSSDPPNLEFEKCDKKKVVFRMTSNLIGVAQGHWMIYHNGARRLLTEKEEEYLAKEENYTDGRGQVPGIRELQIDLNERYETQERSF